MTKLRKSFLVILIAITTLFSCMAVIVINHNNVAYADAKSVNYLANEFYYSTGEENAVTMDAFSENTYEFEVKSAGQYYFKIGYADLASFTININIEGQKIESSFVTLPDYNIDTIVRRVAVQFNVSENYFENGDKVIVTINVSLVNAFQNLSATILLSKPMFIDYINLVSSDSILSNYEQTIIQNSSSVEGLNLILGNTYKLDYAFKNGINGRFKWGVNKGSDASLITIADNSIVIPFNPANDGRSIILDFIDDNGVYSVEFKLKLPFVAKAVFDNCSYDYTIEVTDAYGNKYNEDSVVTHINKIDIQYGGILLNNIKSSKVNLIKVPSLAESDTIEATVYFNYKVGSNVFDYSTNVNKIIVSNKVISFDNFTEAMSYGYKKIVLENTSTGAKTYDRELIVSSDVEAIFINNSLGYQCYNLRLQVKNPNPVYIYSDNLKVAINSDSYSYAIKSLSSNLTFELVNKNIIAGHAEDALVCAEGIEFCGNGSLEIVGANGANGANGVNEELGKVVNKNGSAGENGTNALYCTSFSSSANSIIIKGGNGGRGGNGGNGRNGQDRILIKDGKSSYIEDGTAGGIGGRGGDAGIGCNLNLSGISSVTCSDGYAGWGGNGGNGGRGGDSPDSKSTTVVEIGVRVYRATLTAKGGNGGRGGDAGANGNGKLNYSESMSRGGNGGRGGHGGDGLGINYWYPSASGGVSSFTYQIASAGGNGGNGGNGYIGGRGGDGGNGGKGANGCDAVLFGISGSDGYNGADGGNGGNGGYSYSRSNGSVGSGGSGGKGGAGGEKGNGIFAKYKDGNPGNNGLSGKNGGYL